MLPNVFMRSPNLCALHCDTLLTQVSREFSGAPIWGPQQVRMQANGAEII